MLVSMFPISADIVSPSFGLSLLSQLSPFSSLWVVSCVERVVFLNLCVLVRGVWLCGEVGGVVVLVFHYHLCYVVQWEMCWNEGTHQGSAEFATETDAAAPERCRTKRWYVSPWRRSTQQRPMTGSRRRAGPQRGIASDDDDDMTLITVFTLGTLATM